MIVLDMWFRVNHVCVDLDQHMHGIVDGRNVGGLTNIVGFDAYEEEVKLQEQVSSLSIFA